MKRILGRICLFVSCALLAAALWPFNFVSRNEVSWLSNENGLRFGRKGTIFSLGAFEVAGSDKEPFCSLEIWLEPALPSVKRSETILAFYMPQNPGMFRLMQHLDEFLVQRDYRDQQRHLETAEIKIEHAFHKNERVLFTVISNRRTTSVYRDGVFAESSSRFGLTCAAFSGQLVIGNSPIIYDSWQGTLLGVAFYHQGLLPEQVSQHYVSWTHGSMPVGIQEDGLLALYSLGEGVGSTAHNAVGANPDLHIPERFEIPHKRFLTPPWEEFSPDLGYAWDIAINVAGFVPLGFFLYAYFSLELAWNRATILTIALSGLASLTLEILQGFLPSRDSGITDIITNTVGSGLGVILWRSQLVREFAGRLKLLPW